MGGNSGRKVMPARSGSLGGRRATTFAYAEYDGDVYRWPIDGASGKLTESGYINMVRWPYGAWERGGIRHRHQSEGDSLGHETDP